MYDCPHCGEPVISAWQKAFISPWLPTVCRRCKGKVGVPALPYYLTCLPSLPILAVGVLIPAFQPSVLVTWMFAAYLFILLGTGLGLLAVVFAIRLSCLPLVRR